MNNDLLEFILKTQNIEYAIFNSEFRLIEKSPNLSSFFSTDRPSEPDTHLLDVFYELIGFEETLKEVLAGSKEAIGIDWIGEPTSSIASNLKEIRNINYFNIRVYEFQKGVVVILRNVSEEGDLEQTVYKRRNELDMLSNQLIADLKYSNRELEVAYKTTLEGWAKALELRDVETKGHSERVVEYTIRLAHAMGVKEDDFDQYYYGALLHDIGKMGIPDRVLLKESNLNDEEWTIMRLHPIYGNRLLTSIKHPKFSLDIPTYHHERWNGEGYPFGLKGNNIPLSARIFSVVDVFDALINDRAYRKAWSKDDALNYIEEKSGVQFDPRVVEKFLNLVNDKSPGQVEITDRLMSKFEF